MKRALLVIDVQNDYFGEKFKVTYPSNNLTNILKAMDTANHCKIPIIIIQHSSLDTSSGLFLKDSHGWRVHEEVVKRDHTAIIEKFYPGSFTGTKLDDILKELEVDTVAISGYMTQMCCDTTSRQASHAGYKVEFLSDATGTLSVSNYAGSITAEELHKAILITQAMGFSKVISTSEWIENLAK